jgi:hypothetical protein
MATDSLNYSVPSINLSLQQYDLLFESTVKANALIQVLLLVDLEELANSKILYNFLWALDDIVYRIYELCEHLQQANLSKENNNGEK